MPFNLAVFGSEKADQVIAANPEIDQLGDWRAFPGGSHGSLLCVFNNPGAVDGLFLLAAYPAGSQSLAEF